VEQAAQFEFQHGDLTDGADDPLITGDRAAIAGHPPELLFQRQQGIDSRQHFGLFQADVAQPVEFGQPLDRQRGDILRRGAARAGFG
jgi:hypothetical protein